MFNLKKENQTIEGSLNLSYNKNVTNLPDGLKTKWLGLAGCTKLTRLPDGLKTGWLSLVGRNKHLIAEARMCGYNVEI